MSALRDLIDVGQQALAIGLESVDVELKTNFGPGISIPTSSDGETGGVISDLIGLRGGLIIRNSRGEIIETVGDPAPTDPIRFAFVLAALAVGGFVIVRGLLPRR